MDHCLFNALMFNFPFWFNVLVVPFILTAQVAEVVIYVWVKVGLTLSSTAWVCKQNACRLCCEHCKRIKTRLTQLKPKQKLLPWDRLPSHGDQPQH